MDASYWDAYDNALSEKFDSDRAAYYKALDEIVEQEQADLDKQAKEADAALRARRAAYRLTDLSGDDSSLDSRHH